MAFVETMGGKRPPARMSSKRRRVARLRERLEVEQDPRAHSVIGAQLFALDRSRP